MSTLLTLDNDTFSYICQYLKISAVAKLQRCNKSLFNTIKTSPQCITSLNYSDWILYLKTKPKDITHLSCVKKLYLNNSSHYVIQKLIDFKNIMKYLTHLAVSGIDMKCIRLPKVCPKCSVSQSKLSKTEWLRHLTGPHNCKYKDCQYKCSTQHTYLKHLIDIHEEDDANFKPQDVPWNQCPSLQSLTLHNMQSHQLLQFANYIGTDISSLHELTINRISSDIQPELIHKIYLSNLKKLCISSMHLHRSATMFSTAQFAKINKVFEENEGVFPLFDSITYFSCKHTITANDNFMHLTVLCRQIVCFASNLQHLELKYMSTCECYAIFGDGIKIKSDKLKELILHLRTWKSPQLFNYISTCNFNLRLIDLLMFDKTMVKSVFFDAHKIFAAAQCLLSSQLTNNRSSLRDIILTIEIDSCKRRETVQWNLIESLYSMLVNVFKNENVKYRKELNMTMKIGYEAHTMKWRKNRYLEYTKLNELLNALNKKVACCTLVISFTFTSARFIRLAEWEAFLYHLQCNHQWNSNQRIAPEIRGDLLRGTIQYKRFKEYRITNYCKSYDQRMNISVFESRLNDEKNQYIAFENDGQVLTSEVIGIKMKPIEVVSESKQQKVKSKIDKNGSKYSLDVQGTWGNSDILSVFAGGSENKNSELNFDNKDSNDTDWTFEWNSANKDNYNWKWTLDD